MRHIKALLIFCMFFGVACVSEQADNADDSRSSSFKLSTSILTGPEGIVNESKAAFTFECNKRECVFECQLNDADYSACESGVEYELKPGADYSFSVRAVVGEATDKTVAHRAFYVNAAPTLEAAELSVGPFYKSTPFITVSISGGSDLEDDTPTYEYQWYKNGNPIVGQTDAALSNAFFARDEAIYCEITPVDSNGSRGKVVRSKPAVIKNSEPSAVSAGFTYQRYRSTGDIIAPTINGWSDADGDAEAYEFSWYDADTDLPLGIYNGSVAAENFSPGQRVYVVSTPVNGGSPDRGLPVVSSVVTINTPPTMTLSFSGIDADKSVVSLLPAKTASDIDSDTVLFDYEWYLVVGTNLTPLLGGSAAGTVVGLPNTSFAKGQVIRIVARPLNDLGSGRVEYGASVQAEVTVQNSTPQAPEVSLTQSLTGQLTATLTTPCPSVDLDQDPVTCTTTWTKNDVAQGITGLVVNITPVTGNKWTATVTASDGLDSPKVTSATIFIWPNSWSKVSAGQAHACGTDSGGGLWCWGANTSGQLGDGSTISRQTPLKIGTATWSQIAAGTNHTCAIQASPSSGSLWCWGSNNFGQLGDNSLTQRLAPVREAASATDWALVTVGEDFTCGSRTSGIYCWGDNSYDSVGKVGQLSYSSMQLVAAGTFNTLSSGKRHTCALASNSLYCWGLNSTGQLGQGGTSSYGTPQLMAGSWSKVSAGGAHTCAKSVSDSRLYCWGKNNTGQMGNDTFSLTTPQTAPGLVDAFADWDGIELGESHSCAKKTGGSLWCWGTNTAGALGHKSSEASIRYPVKIWRSELPGSWSNSNRGGALGGVRYALVVDRFATPHLFYHGGVYTITYDTSQSGTWTTVNLTTTGRKGAFDVDIFGDTIGLVYNSCENWNCGTADDGFIHYWPKSLLSAWGGTVPIQTKTSMGPTIAYDPSGNYHIAYVCRTNGCSGGSFSDYRLGVYSSGSSGAYIDGAYSGFEAQVAVDPSGIPHVVYRVGNTGNSPAEIRYKSGSDGWSAGTQIGASGSTSDIAAGPDGKVHVIYRDNVGTLKYRVKTGSTWSNAESVDATVTIAEWPSIRVDKSGIVFILYQDNSSSPARMKLANNSSGVWTYEDVKNPSQTGGESSSSLFIDSAGAPHALFYDQATVTAAYATKTISWLEISAGNDFSCAIHSSTSLYCWGANSDAQLGIGSFVNQSAPKLVGRSAF